MASVRSVQVAVAQAAADRVRVDLATRRIALDFGAGLARLVQDVPGSHRDEGGQVVSMPGRCQGIQVLLEAKTLGGCSAGRVRYQK